MNWNDDTEWERDWWGNCANTHGEEQKQLAYAKRMGLVAFHDGRSPFNFDVQWQNIVDIGGGPVSLLLKCHNLGRAIVVDPCEYPSWVYQRYEAAGILAVKVKAEDWEADALYDEAWMYNVIQHTEDPRRVIANALRAAKVLRLFEWVETAITPGHPHAFTEATLNAMLGGEGKVEELQGEATCYGKCYYGVFKGERYAEV